MEHTARISEVFFSIEGEGPYTGAPTIFVRLFGCNFTCSGYSNPDHLDIKTGADTGELPKIGCDSIYSWHPDYKDRSRKLSVEELSLEILDILDNLNKTATNNIRPILCFTGGEPLLQQRFLTQFINSLVYDIYDLSINSLLFETNCSIKLVEDFSSALRVWLRRSRDRKLIWANSPKLTNSGENFTRAIRPDIFSSQMLFSSKEEQCVQIDRYLKYVSDGSEDSFKEIALVSELYKDRCNEELTLYSFGVPLAPDKIFVMPEGHTSEQQQLIQRSIAEKCLNYGYMFSSRLHCFLFNNEKGT